MRWGWWISGSWINSLWVRGTRCRSPSVGCCSTPCAEGDSLWALSAVLGVPVKAANAGCRCRRAPVCVEFPKSALACRVGLLRRQGRARIIAAFDTIRHDGAEGHVLGCRSKHSGFQYLQIPCTLRGKATMQGQLRLPRAQLCRHQTESRQRHDIMMLPADNEQAVATRRRARFVLRDTADINRALEHLVRHWTPPSVDVRVDRLTALECQRAQDRFTRLTDNCNCMLGEMLGGATLLIGGYATWISARGLPNLLPLTFATLMTIFAGKGIELAWTRVRLIFVLRALRHRLEETIAGRITAILAKPPETRPYRRPSISTERAAVDNARIQRSKSGASSARIRIPLREVRDIDRLVVHLITHWALPHMEVQVDTLPKMAVQRAQDRLVRLSAGYTYLLAAVLAVVSFLVGFAYIVWPPDEIVLWTMHQDWSDVLMALIVTLFAGLIGCVGEILLIRLRLLLLLFGLRRQLRKA